MRREMSASSIDSRWCLLCCCGPIHTHTLVLLLLLLMLLLMPSFWHTSSAGAAFTLPIQCFCCCRRCARRICLPRALLHFQCNDQRQQWQQCLSQQCSFSRRHTQIECKTCLLFSLLFFPSPVCVCQCRPPTCNTGDTAADLIGNLKKRKWGRDRLLIYSSAEVREKIDRLATADIQV